MENGERKNFFLFLTFPTARKRWYTKTTLNL
jgi:hypothetical protein